MSFQSLSQRLAKQHGVRVIANILRYDNRICRLRKFYGQAIAAPPPQGVCNTPLRRNPTFVLLSKYNTNMFVIACSLRKCFGDRRFSDSEIPPAKAPSSELLSFRPLGEIFLRPSCSHRPSPLRRWRLCGRCSKFRLRHRAATQFPAYRVIKVARNLLSTPDFRAKPSMTAPSTLPVYCVPPALKAI